MSELKVWACRAGAIFDDTSSAALFSEYESECANPLLGTTAPRKEQYEALEGTGFAFCFRACVDGVLSGFAFYVMGPPPHYGGLWCATVESLFVMRASRAGGLGKQLMDAVETDAEARGCAAIFYSAPAGSRLAKLLFLCADEYRNTNHVFARRLAPARGKESGT